MKVSAVSPAARRVVLVAPILLLATAVRLLGLGNTDLWGDEAFSVTTALAPVSTLLASLASGEPHPPLYPVFLAGWLRTFGHSEVASRLPSAFAGIASVAVAAAIGARLGEDLDFVGADLGAVVAALLVALNPFQVWYSQEARMYAQVSFFAALSTLALLRLDRSKKGGVVPYALSLVAVAGTHYFGLYVPVAHAVAVGVWRWRDHSLRRRWLAGSAIAAVIYLPWLIYARSIVLGYYGAPPGAVDLRQIALRAWVRVAAGWSIEWSVAVGSALVLTAFALVGAALPNRAPGTGFSRVVLVTWLIVPYVAGYAVSVFRPMYAERYLIVASLPLTLLIARLISRALRPVARQLEAAYLPTRFPVRLTGGPGAMAAGGAGLIVLVATLGLAAIPLDNVWTGRYVKSTYNTHVGDVDALIRSGDVVILDGTSQLPLYNYYLRRPWPTFPLPRALPLDPTTTSTELSDIARTHTGAWIFLYATPDYDPGYFIPRWLAQNAYRTYDNWQVTGRLQYYRFAPTDSLSVIPTDVNLGGEVKLRQIATTRTDVAAGDSVPVLFRWERSTSDKKPLRASLRLIDGSGETWAQADKDVGGDFFQDADWPTGRTLDDRHGLMIPLGTPPGDYRLMANVYVSGSPNPLAPTGSGVTLGTDGIEVASIHVSRASDHLWTRGVGGYQPIGRSVVPGVELLGFAGSTDFTSGSSAPLSLYWKAQADQPGVSTVRAVIATGSGNVAAASDVRLGSQSFPTTAWRTGDVVREMIRVPVPRSVAPGQYQLRIQAVQVNGTTATGSDPVVLGTVKVAAGPPAPVALPPEHLRGDSFGNAITLDGYDLSSADVAPGGQISLKLHWSAVTAVASDYTVFVHVLDAKDKVVAQRDQQPSGGSRPTTAWAPGDQIVDAYELSVPATLPAGSYEIEVGIYNPIDGARLPVSRDNQPAGDRIILTNILVAN